MNLLHKLFLFAQDMYLKFNSYISPEMLHNFEKHDILKKALFLKKIEGIKGDYLEFGSYEGTSLKGAAIYWRKIRNSEKIKFYGFDSFEGMDPEKGDEHPFYTTFDFSTNFKIIKKRFKDFPEVKLVKGFFKDTLKKDPKYYGIHKASIVLIDCDLPSAAKYSFDFIESVIQKGTILILDDYFNYGGGKKGVKSEFQNFMKRNNLICEELLRYGIGGIVFLITDIKK